VHDSVHEAQKEADPEGFGCSTLFEDGQQSPYNLNRPMVSSWGSR
jgi:hypothetical protein